MLHELKMVLAQTTALGYGKKCICQFTERPDCLINDGVQSM